MNYHQLSKPLFLAACCVCRLLSRKYLVLTNGKRLWNVMGKASPLQYWFLFLSLSRLVWA